MDRVRVNPARSSTSTGSTGSLPPHRRRRAAARSTTGSLLSSPALGNSQSVDRQLCALRSRSVGPGPSSHSPLRCSALLSGSTSHGWRGGRGGGGEEEEEEEEEEVGGRKRLKSAKNRRRRHDTSRPLPDILFPRKHVAAKFMFAYQRARQEQQDSPTLHS